MSAHCCGSPSKGPVKDPRWLRALWLALAVNTAMFAIEMSASFASESMALRADALDFLSDSANYMISLIVVGLAVVWQSRAAFFKGATLALLGSWVLASTIWGALHGTAPQPHVMSVIGFTALAANLGVALMLYRFRTGDANMRSVWICSRNDAIGNIAVIFAALGVFGTSTAWPDLIVATIMAGLSVSGGVQIMSHARKELKRHPVSDRIESTPHA